MLSMNLIRKTTPEDLEELLKLFDIAREYMRQEGNPTQWQGYPTKEILLDDIKREESYVLLLDNEIVATMMLSFKEDTTYQDIQGNWITQGDYGVIHRIAVKYPKQHLASELLNFALSYNYPIRIDTHSDNKPMINFLSKHGFEYCGIIRLSNGDPRFAYERSGQ